MATLPTQRRSQRPLSTLLASLAFGTILLAPLACSGSAGESPVAPALAPQGDMIAMLPADATTIGYIDVAQLRDSGIYDFAREQGADIADADGLEEFIAKTGIDPRTDIHRLVWVTTGGLIDGSKSAGAALVVATFERAQLEEALADQPTIQYNGQTLYQLVDIDEAMGAIDENTDSEMEGESGSGIEVDFDTTGLAAIVSDDTIVVGSDAAVRQVIDVRGGAASARANTALMDLLEDVDTDAQMWAVAAREGMLSGFGGSEDMPMPQIPVDRINSMIFSLRVTDGLALTLRGRTGAEEDAKLLGDSLNGMLAFGKMMIQGNQPEIFDILDRGVTAGSSGFDVTIRANLTLEEIETLRGYANDVMSDEGSSRGDIG